MKGLYLIMGGYSYILLGNFVGVVGKYLIIVENFEGEEVFIVQVYCWGEYFGYIDVIYDMDGRVLDYYGVLVYLINIIV